MNCIDIHHDLELHVLGALPPERDAAIRAHVEDCAECSEALDACRQLVQDVRDAADAPPPRPAFVEALNRAVAAETKKARFRSRVVRALAVAGSAAALLLLALRLAQRSETDLTHTLQAKWRSPGASAYPTSVSDGVVVGEDSVYALHRDDAGPHVGHRRQDGHAPMALGVLGAAGYLAADAERVFCLSSTRPRSTAMVALDATDGRELWRYTPGGAHPLRAPCRPVPVAGNRVCWTTGGAVHLLDATTGARLWHRAIEGEGPLSQAVEHDGHIYVVTGKALRCLAAADGAPVWTKPLDASTRGIERPQLALDGHRVYLAHAARGNASRLSCMDVATRKTLWTRPVPRTRWLLAADGGVYIRGERIHAVDRSTGDLLWNRAADGCGPLTHRDGRLYYIDVARAGALVVLDGRTGAKAWEFAGLRSCDAFTSVGGTGYVRTVDGTVRAFALRTPGRS